MPLQRRVQPWIKRSPALFSTWALLTLSGCCGIPTSVAVSDHTLYYQKQASAADWVTELHFLTTASQDLTEAEWNSLSEGQVCMALADWSEINKMISAFCSSSHIDCEYPVANGKSLKDTFNEFFSRLEIISGASFRRIQ